MKRIFTFIMASFLALCALKAKSETIDTIVKNEYTLIVIDKSSDFDGAVKARLEQTFFQIYPQLVKRFNKNAAKTVVFVIDPEYDGVAATARGRIVFSVKWFKNNPKDIDVVTHEAMHVVQNYGRTPAPGWITEGIADYVRYKYGVANEEGNWKMPDVDVSHSYTNSYRVTARFFAWLENHVNKKIIDELDSAVRNRTYDNSFWEKMTSKTIDKLWEDYLAAPKL